MGTHQRTEWDGTEDRAARNREKKKRDKENRKRKIEKACKIGKCTIGVGPIKSRSYDYFNTNTADFEEAKKMATAEFLAEYLKFNHKDMTDMNITDTRISAKRGDNMLYIVLDSPGKVKNIRKRIADIKKHQDKNAGLHPATIFSSATLH